MIKYSCSALALIFTVFLSGCIAIYKHRDVVVEVIDFETGEPVEGAEVVVSYDPFFQINPPKKIEAMTPASGRLELRVPTFQDGGSWSVRKHDSYMSTGLHSPFSKWAREHAPEAFDGDRIRLWMLRKPQPRAVLLLPEAFTGLLRLEFEPQPVIPGPITRHFEIAVPPDGLVHIREDGGLQVVNWHEARCVYPDGLRLAHAQLSRQPDPTGYGVYWLGSAPYRSMYLIGTAAQARRVHEFMNNLTYDKLGGLNYESDTQLFDAVFENPSLLDQHLAEP